MDSEIGPPNICELDILFTTDEKIRILNREYRRKDKATDVLSFPMHEKQELQRRKDVLGESLGDLVISEETTLRQAKEFGVTPTEETVRLIVHGILHLCGYDHEKVPASEAQRMRRKERRLREVLLTSRTRAA